MESATSQAEAGGGASGVSAIPAPRERAERRRAKRRVRSYAEAEELVAMWRASGQSQESFVRTHGLKRSTLSSCRRRVMAHEAATAGAEKAPAGFVALTGPSPTSSGSAIRLEVTTADGYTLRVPPGWQARECGALLRALREAGA